MILPDVNILLYAIDETSPHHAPAKAWLEKCLSGTETFALTWSVLGAFLRLTTRAAVFARPLELAQAFDLVDSWLAQPSVAVVHPTPRHHIVLRRLLEPLGTAGNLVPDAHLAALALEHGATVASCDRDFGRFVGVAWSDPMSG